MKRIMTFLAAVLMATSAFAQDWARAKLEKSPRHQEWVTVSHDKREVSCFIVYPEWKDKTTTVVLIHEIFGMTDWVRSTADQLAAAGYIVIAPDLLSGMGPKGGGSDDFGGTDSARRSVSELPPDQVTADLNAVVAYGARLPSANGSVAVGGFCWGGSQTFQFATNSKDIKAAFVFYGSGPDKEEDIARIQCPVFGFYGGNDARVGATVPKSVEWMKKAIKTYEPVTYESAGHGFMRAGEAPDANDANKKARDEAWKRWLDLLKKM
ncbi:MAG: dienelactone hydrolase family protein [Verrucomicrobiae bacterium]|nr:dienelactone hydrolase family protein [Verrucomicrobiae bacterium]